MPSYDYRCNACGKEMEISHRISEPPRRVCPLCGAEGLERLVSRSSFALKGSGWYSDGYGASGGSGSEKPAKPASATPDTSTAAPDKKESSPAPAEKPAAPTTPKSEP